MFDDFIRFVNENKLENLLVGLGILVGGWS